MSNDNLGKIKNHSAPRLGFEAYGIGRERYLELHNGCATGKYSIETLQEACKEFEFIAPWIIISVTKSKSYEGLRCLWELKEIERIPVGRTDFYGFRRKFYHNLDLLLKENAER